MKDHELFIKSCREALYYYTENKEIRKYAKEATPYQVVHLVMTERLTNEKENIIKENIFFDEFMKVISEDKMADLHDMVKKLGIKPKLVGDKYVYDIDFNKYPGLEKYFDNHNRATFTTGANQTTISYVMSPEGNRELERLGYTSGSIPNASDVFNKHPQLKDMVLDKTTNKTLIDPNSEKYSTLQKLAAQIGAMGIAAQLTIGFGALAVAALLIFAAYKTYKRFFSKAAKACKKYSSTEKSLCMEKFKLSALKIQERDLNNGFIKACKKSKDPKKCEMAIKNKLYKLKKKAIKIQANIDLFQAKIYSKNRGNL